MLREKKVITSVDLGINLKTKRESEFFKWFLACLLFGKPIQQSVVQKTYYEFIKDGLDNPDSIINAGWDHLVEVLHRGHYVRYDFSTATKLLDICGRLKKEYGSVTNLIKTAGKADSLHEKLMDFKGIGTVTAGICVRDLLGIVYPKKRVFVGASISYKTGKRINDIKNRNINLKIRWIDKKNLHITLVPPWYEYDIERISEVIKKALYDIKPAELMLAMVEVKNGLVWLRGSSNKQVSGIKRKLYRALEVEDDPGKFIPHVTIARFRKRDLEMSDLNKVKQQINWMEKLNNIVLYEVKFKKRGADYIPLANFKL